MEKFVDDELKGLLDEIDGLGDTDDSDDGLSQLDDIDLDNIDEPASELDAANVSDYSDGLEISSSELLKDEEDSVEEPYYEEETNSFISSTGDVVVMDKDLSEDGFEFEYIDIANIMIVKRIRKNDNVADMVKTIKSTGLLYPIVVGLTATDGIYVLLSGGRRLTACAMAGMKRVPCVINKKVNTSEIPIIEAMYNHCKRYSIKEIIDYIDYLEKEKGIMSPTFIEYLLQLESGDYSKLKDVLNDNDDEIVSRLFDGSYTIGDAFRKLEQRRKKESAEEKANRKAAAVYDDTEKSGADLIEGVGEESDESCALTESEVKELAINADELDDGLDDVSLNDMIEEGKEVKGFGDKAQEAGNREETDPTVRKAAFVRDLYTCQCCKEGGESYIDVLEGHHIVPVMFNRGDSTVSKDSIDNIITLCIKCHRQVHLYSTNELSIPKEKSAEDIAKMTDEEKVLYEAEQMKFKRIVKLGTVIRKGMEKRGIKLEAYKKENSSRKVGKHMPGYRNGISVQEVRATTSKENE